MILSSIEIQNFRSYEKLHCSFDKEGAVFIGENGIGKTNILESIHILVTGRSQRNSKKTHFIRNGASECNIQGTFITSYDEKEHVSMGFSRSSKSSFIYNKEKIRSLSEWFYKVGIVSFAPDDINLILGPPINRRRWIDMVLSQIDPHYLNVLIKYRRLLIHRNNLFSLNASSLEYETYESEMAKCSVYIVEKREQITHQINNYLHDLYGAIGMEKEEVYFKYNPSFKHLNSANDQWNDVFFNTLKLQRSRDITLGFTSSGPHRDDFACKINGKTAREYASQGQCRTLAITLKLSSIDLIGKSKNRSIIILVDDAFSQLDDSRTEKICTLVEGRGQLFLTRVSSDKYRPRNLSCFEVDKGCIKQI